MIFNNNTKNFIRGGQVILHNIRMFNQIVIRVILFSLLVILMINIAWFCMRTTTYERYVISEWFLAKSKIVLNAKAEQDFKQPDGEVYQVYSKDVLSSGHVDSVLNKAKDVLFECSILGLFLYFFVFYFIKRWLKKRGLEASLPKYIRGDLLASPEEIKRILKKSEKNVFYSSSKDGYKNNKKLLSLKVSKEKIPIPTLSFKQHFLFHGSTGTGKSMTIKEFLDQLRDQNESVFIYDKGCVLTEEYFDQEKDVLMNCLDERTVEWDLWTECRDLTEFEAFATAQIPMPANTHDPFWVGASRTIFAQAANRMRKNVEKPRLLTLLQCLLTAELEDIKELLKGTVAESLMSEKIEKTAISIKSVLATYLKSLCYVKEGGNPFSIRHWIEESYEKKRGQWLFISSRGDKHETLKPLITAWIDIAINTLLSLPESAHRRIWFILDEFTSLHQLPKITDGLSEGRKFGGCFAIGIQNISKLNDVYGGNGAKNISALLNTRFMFRQPDPDVAAWSAKNLGETDFEEANESISYGANTMRDGISINRSERRKPVVTYSEIMNLNDLECYLRLAGNYPISKIKIGYQERKKISKSFIPRNIEHDDLRAEVEAMIENLKKRDGDEEDSQDRFTLNQKEKKKDKKTKKETRVKMEKEESHKINKDLHDDAISSPDHDPNFIDI